MPTKLLPTEYLGASYDGTSSSGVIKITASELTNGGLTSAEIVQGTSVNPGSGGVSLTSGLTYTITALGTASSAAVLKAAWVALGWNSSGDDDAPVVGDTFTATGVAAQSTLTYPSVVSCDIRRVAMGICESLFSNYRTYATAGTSPDKMTISRSTFFDDTSDALSRSYTITFLTDVTSVEVQEEAAD